MIISPAPENYQDTKLYKVLLHKSKPKDGLIEKVTSFISTVKPLQEFIIAGPFKDYTLHNPNHSKKLLHIAEYIIPERCLDKLSPLELAVIIMSFYLHDLGMTLTQTERERIIKSKAFDDFLQFRSEFGTRIDQLRKILRIEEVHTNKLWLEVSIFQITEAALSEYLRPVHATRERYVDLVKIIKESSDRNDLFDIEGVSFFEELIEVCISHNLSANSLIETKGIHEDRFSRELMLSGFQLNLQFCCAVLRIADILDFDRERTPKSLFKALGIQNKRLPGFEISLKEWNKHIAVHTISINTEEILISGDSNHPNIEHSIKEFCKNIELEIRDTQTVLKQNKPEILEKYELNIPFLVRANIRSQGYIYKEYSIKLNEAAIVNLLMGENLYINPFAAVREILQNSIDACDLRSKIEKNDYSPSIVLSSYKDADSRTWLKIEDNGIGMDEYVLSNFFFKVGNSYYSSSDFKRFSTQNAINNFVPISRFGIGLLSVFMIGEAIKLTTKNGFSDRKDFKKRVLFIDGVESLAVVTEENEGNQGTVAEVLLRTDRESDVFINKTIGYIKNAILRPKVPITLRESETTVQIISDNYIRLNYKNKQELEKYNIEFIDMDFSRFSDILKGKCIFFFFKNEDGSLSYYDKKNKITMGIYPLKPSLLFENYFGGSRVTVNGMAMVMKKIGSLFNLRARTCSVVLDVEVSGIEPVEYNVSRQKIFGKGTNTVKKEIFNSIDKCIKEIGIYDRLDEATKEMFELVFVKKISEKLDEDIMNKIAHELKGIKHLTNEVYRDIAKRLDMNKHLVRKYISGMIHTGKIHKEAESY